jgi:CheY-like chemotaxis protein
MQMIKSIVFIDDDPIVNFINRRLIEVSLQDVNVMTFEDAREAHKYLLSSGENDRDNFPEILMIDINMPETDGWKFLELLSRFPRSVLATVKIYVLTASISERDIEKSRRYPIVSAFLSKPLLPETVEVLFQSPTRVPQVSLPHRA